MNKVNAVKPVKVKILDLCNGVTREVEFCPGCWNKKIGRAFLLAKLKNIGYKVISKYDGLQGKFLEKMYHLKGCPNPHLF